MNDRDAALANPRAVDLGRRLAPPGFPPEERPFSAHLTLGRSRDAPGLAGALAARGGHVYAVVSEGDTHAASLAEVAFPVPPAPPLLAPLRSIIPLRFLAYHVADLKGTDVDQPRNLAKSVTVE